MEAPSEAVGGGDGKGQVGAGWKVMAVTVDASASQTRLTASRGQVGWAS